MQLKHLSCNSVLFFNFNFFQTQSKYPHCELFNHVWSSDQSSAPPQSAVNQEESLSQAQSSARSLSSEQTCSSPVRCEGTTQVHMEVLQVFESYGCLYVHKEYPQGDGGQTDSPLCKRRRKGFVRQHRHATNWGENLDPLYSCTLNPDTSPPTTPHHHHQLARQQALLIPLWHPMVVNVAGKKRQRAQNTASKHLSLPQLALGFQSDTWSLVVMGGMPLNQSDIQPTRRSSLTYAMSNSKKSFIGKCAWAWLDFKKNLRTLFGGVNCKADFFKPRDYLPQKKKCYSNGHG